MSNLNAPADILFALPSYIELLADDPVHRRAINELIGKLLADRRPGTRYRALKLDRKIRNIRVIAFGQQNPQDGVRWQLAEIKKTFILAHYTPGRDVGIEGYQTQNQAVAGMREAIRNGTIMFAPRPGQQPRVIQIKDKDSG